MSRLSQEQALEQIGALPLQTINALAVVMRDRPAFLAFAQRVVAHMAQEGWALDASNNWTKDQEPSASDAERLTDIALADGDDARALMRATGQHLGRELRLRLMLEALYAQGGALTDTGAILPP